MVFSAGTFNWVDLNAKDMERAKAFYGQLFGWTFELQDTRGGPPYGIFFLRGKQAAGVGRMSDEMISQGVSSMWNTYVSTDDIDATEKAIETNGGRLMFETMTVLEAGKMNFARDPEGATFAIWEPIGHAGVEVYNEPDSFCWSERATRDLDDVEQFYGAVFDWQFRREEVPVSKMSMIHNAKGREQGHALLMTDEWEGVPPHWSPYFAVADCDATVERAKSLGGANPVPPFDIDVGRMAALADPDGATFYVIRIKDGLADPMQ
jgi:hypothetical protein